MVIRYVHSADEPSDAKKLFIVHIESISKKQYIGLIKFHFHSILLGRLKVEVDVWVYVPPIQNLHD